MRVLVVAQAYKASLGIRQVAEALAAGVRRGGGDPTVLLASDGGDGLLDVLAPGCVRQTRHVVTGPLGAPVTALVGWLDAETAVIESARVCGLALVPRDQRDPERTTTRGVGELMTAVVRAGAAHVIVGLGGSATMDGGTGMAATWRRDAAIDVLGLCDVTVPLAGAARFAAQKGADEATAARLAARLAALAREHPAAAALPGAGAAGGLGFGLAVHAGASLVAGAPWVLARAGFADALARADLVLVTEGAFDGTSAAGKLAGTVLAAAAGKCRAGIVAPSVTGAPPDVLVEAGGGAWGPDDLARHAAALVRRASAP